MTDVPNGDAPAAEAGTHDASTSTSMNIDCVFGDQVWPFPVHVGEPVPDAHPLEQQAAWLERERGGVVPPDVMDSFGTLQRIALENNVSFQELCVYAFSEARANGEAEQAASEATEVDEAGEPVA